MNLVLLFQSDFISKDRVRLTGRRGEHLTAILKVEAGDTITAGLCNGNMGQAKVLEAGEEILLQVDLSQPPPAALPLTLIIPMIRPPMFKRLLFHTATLGIKKIIVLNFSRVEKSLWQSSALKEDDVRHQLVLGLEQAKDTVLPEVIIRPQFKPFVEDELPSLAKGTLALVAHPGSSQPCPKGPSQPVTLVIGPEGGLLDYELQKLTDLGFGLMDLGPRILRVESALPYIIGRLF